MRMRYIAVKKRAKNYLFLFGSLLLALYVLTSCQRKDVLFSAYDEIHGIYLYENGNDFDISYIGGTFSGTYTYRNDTIFLSYDSGEPSEGLSRKLVIDPGGRMVHSAGGEAEFCANVGPNKLNKRQ